jgi:predicted aldo/keto reductase-like oxidoreductase
MNRKDQKFSRRNFVKVVAGTTGLFLMPDFALAKSSVEKRTAVDQVFLGQSGVKVSRLGIGTGSRGGRIQREMGQKKFEHVVRYALERGITFIDTADTYDAVHEMLRPVIRSVDREKIQIQCKIWPGRYADTFKELDRFRRELSTDYFDSFLIHCVQTADWPEQYARLRDDLDKAKQKQIIRSNGCSMHGLEPLRAAALTSWGDIRFCRVNHLGKNMDYPNGERKKYADVQPVLESIKKMHAAGKGIIGMKLIGNGDFTDPDVRKKSIRFVMGLDTVDAVVIGLKSTKEIDEAIENIDQALNL